MRDVVEGDIEVDFGDLLDLGVVQVEIDLFLLDFEELFLVLFDEPGVCFEVISGSLESDLDARHLVFEVDVRVSDLGGEIKETEDRVGLFFEEFFLFVEEINADFEEGELFGGEGVFEFERVFKFFFLGLDLSGEVEDAFADEDFRVSFLGGFILELVE